MRKLLLTSALMIPLMLSACGEDSLNLPDGFEVVHQEANVFFVYLHKDVRGKKHKAAHRRGSTALCDYHGMQSCEVYMWSKRDRIPEGLPIRKQSSFFHAEYSRSEAGKKNYKCQECS